MVEEIGVPRGNHQYVICAKDSFYTVQCISSWDQTYIPHTDIGYRPVSQYRQYEYTL
jgi:hypothetical protein